MQVSKLIMLLEKKIREADVTQEMMDDMASLATSIPSNLRSKKDRSHKDDDEKDDNKNNKSKKNNKTKKVNDVEEQDSPFDAFDDQIEKEKSDKIDKSEYLSPEQLAAQQQATPKAEKPKFTLDNVSKFELFKDLVNRFRASDSINKSDATQKFYDKLTFEEKQFACLLFDALAKTLNSVDNPEFKMPKTPKQYGLSLSSTSNKQQPQQHKQTAPSTKIIKNKDTSQQSIQIEKKPKINATNPIVVGESKNNSLSIEHLLRGIK